MKTDFFLGALSACCFFALLWFSYRLSKRISRRCRRKECGCTFVTRIHKILLPLDEVISYKSPEGKWRWFIRRPIKLTFARCKCKWIELVKIDTDPTSVWHARWVRRFHPEQYYLSEPELIEATHRKLRRLYLGSKHENLESGATDTPPLSLEAILLDSVEEVSDLLEKL
ncbi:MAG: hypothetical protein A2849_01000 [Candidatus Taylorbacteria bacterium RIFCSPHIGHO2_01_FULL_51_15]|uniref:Uncharacterized protein n=1 Tax=Candidatus Taylorbacteria bacterium RIFCSPHIGHO2_01_FULL_51_15 TaxID=1802304 RepID=A0A1G2M8V0_9BACT|nr:MAG: hypothetical protein A2849_01000 [Candidatus Taylorbacteria bacterium RIFCSPHIGHO2_01_FULL_51_15]